MPFTPLFLITHVDGEYKHPLIPGSLLFEDEVLHYMKIGRNFRIKFITLIDHRTMEIYQSISEGELNVTDEIDKLLEERDYSYHNNMDESQNA